MDLKLRKKGNDPIKRNEGKEIEQLSETNFITVKVGVIGDTHCGKTSLMEKYVGDGFDRDYIETLGVNFVDKVIKIKNLTVTLTLWDLGGQHEYKQLMPLLCSDARVFLFVFDLTRKRSLSMIKQWYKNVRKVNKHAIPFLIGAKFDLFDKKDLKFREEITTQARKFARVMKAPLIYCSSTHAINIRKIFQIVIAQVFHIRPKIPEVKKFTEPIVEYKRIWATRTKKKKKKIGNKCMTQKKGDKTREKIRPGRYQRIEISPMI